MSESETKKESVIVNDSSNHTSTPCEEKSHDDTVSTTNHLNKEEEEEYTKDDLIDLVSAVKFSNPDASIRDVHREITEQMSKNESFEFLTNVKLNDVKKVWKKANAKNNNAPKNQHAVMKFYTVGNGNVQMLAQTYTAAAAKQAAEEVAKQDKLRQEEMKQYVHVFLNVPADRSGKRPHQALINFNENQQTAKKQPQQSSSSNKKKDRNNNNTNNNNNTEEIVKIQVAASLPGMEDTPMLLYNSNRTAKTFIHPCKDDDDDAYGKIRTLVQQQGVGGALGQSGGTKGYFYSRITKRKNDQDIISINIAAGLAPTQSW